MNNINKHITVFEYQSLILNNSYNGVSFNEEMLKALQQHCGENGVNYFSLINNGVKFNQYVGVIQIGDTIIEILPKLDKIGNKDTWRKNLIGMLQAVGSFKVQAPTNSDLQLKSNSILDLYFELFVREVEYLFRRGLVKRYRKIEGNVRALKGSLHFAKHIQNNIVHQERFYIRYMTYDKVHKLHYILYKTIRLLSRINTNPYLSSRLSSLLLDFPEMPNVNVSDALFAEISYDRKTECYKPAIDIARLLLLNYYPDLSRGADDVLALMFDMNLLWEKFVYVSLLNSGKFHSVEAQDSKLFWKSKDFGLSSYMKPDIVIDKKGDECVILDTKWKNLYGCSPSSEDLRQMYAYMMYYNAKKVALLYPGERNLVKSGIFTINDNNESSIIELCVNNDISIWQDSIVNFVFSWKAF